MLIEKCGDPAKSVTYPPGIRVDGVPLFRCTASSYWCRWGRHAVDVRVLLQVLGVAMPSYQCAEALESDKNFGVFVFQLKAHLAELGMPMEKAIEAHDKALPIAYS